jgi:Protein of unknown function (DUF1565).
LRGYLAISISGSDDNDGSEENPFALIQHGINAASDGDTVLVHTGTYVENINFNGKNISVIGENRETTIIDGNQSGSVVSFNHGELQTTLLKGFTITNGIGSNDDYIDRYGGGIYCFNASPILDDLTISNNSSHAGGGVYLHNFNSTFTNSTIANNSSNLGGGIFHHSGNADYNNLIITNNHADEGGGINFNSGDNQVSIYSSDISLNNGTTSGGGIYVEAATTIIITDSEVSDNLSAYGGGVYIEGNVELIGSSISNNVAGTSGGGIYFYNGSDGILNNVLITSNTSSDNGAGIYCFYSSPTLTDVTISNNSGRSGCGNLV